MTLEDEPNRVVPVHIPILVFKMTRRLAKDFEVSLIVFIEASDDVEQGRFTATRRSQYGNEFVLAEIDSDSVERALGEIADRITFCDVFKSEHKNHVL